MSTAKWAIIGIVITIAVGIPVYFLTTNSVEQTGDDNVAVIGTDNNVNTGEITKDNIVITNSTINFNNPDQEHVSLTPCGPDESLKNGKCVKMSESSISKQLELPFFTGWDVTNVIPEEGSEVIISKSDSGLDAVITLKGLERYHSYGAGMVIFNSPGKCTDFFGQYKTAYCGLWSKEGNTRQGEHVTPLIEITTDKNGDGTGTWKAHNISPGTYEIAFMVKVDTGITSGVVLQTTPKFGGGTTTIEFN